MSMKYYKYNLESQSTPPVFVNCGFNSIFSQSSPLIYTLRAATRYVPVQVIYRYVHNDKRLWYT